MYKVTVILMGDEMKKMVKTAAYFNVYALLLVAIASCLFRMSRQSSLDVCNGCVMVCRYVVVFSFSVVYSFGYVKV
jgi:hypothetical protein